MRQFRMCGYHKVNLTSGNKPGRELKFIEFNADGYLKESSVKEEFSQKDIELLTEKGYNVNEDKRFQQIEIKFLESSKKFEKIIMKCQFRLEELVNQEWVLIESGCQC